MNRLRRLRLNEQITQIVLLLTVSCFLFSVSVFAGASITLTGTPDPPTALGTQVGNTTTNFTGWTITNNSGGIEDIQIDVTSTGSWTPASTAAANNFVLKANPTSGGAVTKVVTAAPTNLRANMANNATHVLKLDFTTPTGGDGQHELTVTLTATNFACISGGYLHGGVCWFYCTNNSYTCDYVCAQQGLTCQTSIQSHVRDWQVCENTFGHDIRAYNAGSRITYRHVFMDGYCYEYDDSTSYNCTFESSPSERALCPCH